MLAIRRHDGGLDRCEESVGARFLVFAETVRPRVAAPAFAHKFLLFGVNGYVAVEEALRLEVLQLA